MYKPLGWVLVLIFTNFRTNSFNLLALIIGIIFCASMCLLLYWHPFIKNSGLSKNKIIFLLGLKVAAALVFSFIVKDSNIAGDYTFNNKIGLQEYQILKNNTPLFFTDFGQHNNESLGELFSAEKSFWDDVAGNILVKFLAILNIFTQGNFYLNSILFSLLGFLASVALYRTAMLHQYSECAALICSFLIISCVGFTAAIHKDSMVFFALALSIFHFCSYLGTKRIFSLVFFILFVSLLFCMRNYVVICFLPAALAYWLSKKLKPAKAFAFVYASLILLVIIIQIVSPQKNLSTTLALRQSQYLALEPGGSYVGVTPLEPTLYSVFANLPEALIHVVISPLQLSSKKPVHIFWSMEIVFYWLIVVAGILIFYLKKQKMEARLGLFYLSLAITALIIIGLIVPNAGAIIRYRVIFFPLLLLPFVQQLNIYINNKNI